MLCEVAAAGLAAVGGGASGGAARRADTDLTISRLGCGADEILHHATNASRASRDAPNVDRSRALNLWRALLPRNRSTIDSLENGVLVRSVVSKVPFLAAGLGADAYAGTCSGRSPTYGSKARPIASIVANRSSRRRAIARRTTSPKP